MSYESDIYAKYAAGELSEEERLQLERSGELKEIEDILNAVDKLKIPPYDLDNAYIKLKQRNQNKRKPSIVRRLALPLSIAASLLLLTGAFLFFSNRATTLATDHSKNKTHLFQDGTEITLNRGSTIRFNEKNWEKERNVSLNGEAYFKVEKGVPFTVKTTYGEIQVLGTSFNIRTHDDLLAVKCFSGKVEVINQKGKQVVLKANEAVRLVNQQFEQIKPVDEYKPLWQSGVSEFKNTNVKWVFKELERQYDIKVTGNIPNEKFTGRFIHQNLQEALEQICKPLNLKYIHNNQNIIIKTKQ